MSHKTTVNASRIDGKAFAEQLRHKIAHDVADLKDKHGITPGLAVVIVGDDPASHVYVTNKVRQTREAGMLSQHIPLAADIRENTLINTITELNADDSIHGILVQLPLPGHINSSRVLETIDPEKDVDGFHVTNVGALSIGAPGFVPCTPLGSMMLLKETLGSLTGLDAVVVGRSNIVGKPMAQLLLDENATVTITHSRTRNLKAKVAAADIVIAAVGRPEMIRGDWIKPGATVIDVGINRIPAPEKGEGKTRLVGDVAFDEAYDIAGHITPVPGGVGPMTIACLLFNTVKAARRQNNLPKIENY